VCAPRTQTGCDRDGSLRSVVAAEEPFMREGHTRVLSPRPAFGLKIQAPTGHEPFERKREEEKEREIERESCGLYRRWDVTLAAFWNAARPARRRFRAEESRAVTRHARSADATAAPLRERSRPNRRRFIHEESRAWPIHERRQVVSMSSPLLAAASLTTRLLGSSSGLRIYGLGIKV